MTIVVSTHNQKEESELLAFLDKLKYVYVKEEQEDSIILSDGQQQEILERDRQYEAGEMKTYSLDEVIARLNIKE